MTKNANRMLQADNGSANATKPAYQATKLFVKYLTLVQAMQVARDEACEDAVIAERDKVTNALARKRARNLGEVFEKIYVWRMESFDPSDSGFIYFDDLFPLSVYFDLKRMIRFDGASRAMDFAMEHQLRKEIEKPSMDQEELICESAAPFSSAESTKVH